MPKLEKDILGVFSLYFFEWAVVDLTNRALEISIFYKCNISLSLAADMTGRLSVGVAAPIAVVSGILGYDKYAAQDYYYPSQDSNESFIHLCLPAYHACKI